MPSMLQLREQGTHDEGVAVGNKSVGTNMYACDLLNSASQNVSYCMFLSECFYAFKFCKQNGANNANILIFTLENCKIPTNGNILKRS